MASGRLTTSQDIIVDWTDGFGGDLAFKAPVQDESFLDVVNSEAHTSEVLLVDLA
jgi:hypothetical protein